MAEQLTARHGSEGLVGLLLRLRGYGISDSRLVQAVEAIRHDRFLPADDFEKAWEDKTRPIACGQTMPSPDTTLRMVAALMPESAHAVLEIGAGTGYQTALLARLSKKVHTVERYKTLLAGARATLENLGAVNVTYEHADGASADGAKGVYDRILVDSAFHETPRALLDKLVSNGVVVTAIGAPGEEQMAVRLTKIGSRFEREDLFRVRLGPLEQGVAASL